MRFDIAREGEQIKVEGPMLRCERAEEGSNMGRHVETCGDAAGVPQVVHTGRTGPETDRGCM
eukprot:2911019-Pleurochrysis_carterae.AAC.1